MKFIKISTLLFVLNISIASAQFIKAEVQVSGLTCSMCSKATEKALHTLEFIGNIQTDLNRNVFILTFLPNANVDLGQISKKVQNAGFSVNNLKATFNFAAIQPNNNAFNYQGDTYLIVNGVNKPLTGQLPVTVVDKGFAPASVYKKYNGQGIDAKTGKLYRVII